MLCKAMKPLGSHWWNSLRSAADLIAKYHINKTRTFSPCSTYQQGFCLITPCVGEESRHCCITHWPEQGKPLHMFLLMCVYTLQTELLNQLLWFCGGDKGIRVGWLCHRGKKRAFNILMSDLSLGVHANLFDGHTSLDVQNYYSQVSPNHKSTLESITVVSLSIFHFKYILL